MLAGAQLVRNAFCPFGPVMSRVNDVSGRSGTPEKVTELLSRLTLPTSEKANGGGKETVIVGWTSVPPSVTMPCASAGAGNSGEVADAVPTVHALTKQGRSAVAFGLRLAGR